MSATARTPVSARLLSPSTALFIDAGWLLATAAIAVLGTSRRDQLACSYRDLLGWLTEVVCEHSGGMHQLRTYWYDASLDGTATWEHNRIATLPYVSIRLGRLNRDRQQKGVDILIYRDLVRLASERAITRAYLLAGDEDLRAAVRDVKETGVQVVLLGMRVEQGHNLSGRLAREADEFLVLPDAGWQGHFRQRERSDEDVEETVADARKIGEHFARQWAEREEDSRADELLKKFPTLPQDLDIELLNVAEQQLGSLRRRPNLKQELRASFWFALKALVEVRQENAPPPTPGRGR
jgi:uncharacterized LabA/DUF88 family protein